MTYPKSNTSGTSGTVVVADRARARIFHFDTANPTTLVEVETLAHPESRLLDQALASSSPGLTRGSGYSQSSATQSSSPHDNEAEHFAREVAQRLEQLRNENALGRLHLAAEPNFLGMLRAELDPSTQRQVVGEINRRLTDLTLNELRAVLPATL